MSKIDLWTVALYVFSLQVNCGASYAFASVGALEGAYSLTFDRSAEELSEQNIIDCSGKSAFLKIQFIIYYFYNPFFFCSLQISFCCRMLIHLTSFSLLFFSGPEGNNGCKGGNMYNSFMYIIFNDGVDSATSYKYQEMVSECLYFKDKQCCKHRVLY